MQLDRDDDSEEEEGEEEGEENEQPNGTNGKTDLKGKGKAVAASNNDDDDDEDDDDSSDEEEDDEDETAELLRELEKIKRERAEEKERQVSHYTSLAYWLCPNLLMLTNVYYVCYVGTRKSSIRCYISRRASSSR